MYACVVQACTRVQAAADDGRDSDDETGGRGFLSFRYRADAGGDDENSSPSQRRVAIGLLPSPLAFSRIVGSKGWTAVHRRLARTLST